MYAGRPTDVGGIQLTMQRLSDKNWSGLIRISKSFCDQVHRNGNSWVRILERTK